MKQQRLGLISALAAITAFGLTLPVTRYAGAELDPLLIGVGRAAIAGLVAGAILWWRRVPFPAPAERRYLLVVIAGVVLGFPLFSSLAMQLVPATHGGVVMGILPLLTAFIARFITGESPSPAFWSVSLLGATLVVLYMLPDAGLHLSSGDLLLLLASISAAAGYAFGGQLSKQMPGWQVICWALVLALPLTIPSFLWQLPDVWQHTSVQHWVGFLYLALVSQLFGFFLWYRGLALGGISRISQVQLLQPFITLTAAWIWLGEPLQPDSLVYASLIVITVFVGQKIPVYRKG